MSVFKIKFWVLCFVTFLYACTDNHTHSEDLKNLANSSRSYLYNLFRASELENVIYAGQIREDRKIFEDNAIEIPSHQLVSDKQVSFERVEGWIRYVSLTFVDKKSCSDVLSFLKKIDKEVEIKEYREPTREYCDDNNLILPFFKSE